MSTICDEIATGLMTVIRKYVNVTTAPKTHEIVIALNAMASQSLKALLFIKSLPFILIFHIAVDKIRRQRHLR